MTEHSRRTPTAILALLALLAVRPAIAHVGSPDTFFAGNAGPWPVRVTIRPPGVVPGLAEISVRVEGPPGAVRRVTVRPMHTSTGRRGAPAADVATPVAGQPGLFSGALWLMADGEYAIEVVVEGSAGRGRALVPVASVATRQLPMGPGLLFLVIAFAFLLVGGGLAIVFAAASESTLYPGEIPSAARRKRARVATGVAAVLFLVLLLGERAWSRNVADASRRNLYRPYDVRTQVRRESSGRVLRLSVDDPRWGGSGWRPLVPDHGKLVHLFAMREPGLDAFAHLHPVAVSDRTFETPLPALPAGTYSLFADVTDETGFAQTLVSRAEIPAPAAVSAEVASGSASAGVGDPDDSWRLAAPLPPVIGSPKDVDVDAGEGFTMRWEGQSEAAVAGRDAMLTFSVRGPDGKLVALEPYMGMLAHAAVMRDDGSVFVHLHPMGTVSMASLAAAEKAGAPAVPAVAAAGPMADMEHDGTAHGGRVLLPYAFPKPGPYRIWVQVKSGGVIHTGVFDALVR